MPGDRRIEKEDDLAEKAPGTRVEVFTDREFRQMPAFALITALLIVPVLHLASYGDRLERSYSSLNITGEAGSGLDQKGSTNPQSLSTSEARLVNGSMRAIVETGISEAYFHQHFHVVSVIDKPGDRRVVWKFSIMDYE